VAARIVVVEKGLEGRVEILEAKTRTPGSPTIKSTHQPAKGASAALRVPFSPACEPTFSLLKEGRQPARERVIG